MKKYLVELIGTFFLVLVIGLTVIEPGGAGAMAPVAIGLALMAMIYAGGHISGAHYNPAVTLAVFVRGKCDAKDVAPYMASQVLGGVLAALTVSNLKGGANVSASTLDTMSALIAELLFTFALAFVILNVATAKKTEGNSYYGFAIGCTVTAGAYAVGAVSGAAFNPAVAIGVTVCGLSTWGNIWIFLIGNFAGGALAAVVFKFVCADE